MTFDELVATFARHLVNLGEEDHEQDDARNRLLEWLDDVDDEEPVLSREVAIVLASANFKPEITTTVLWLNEFYGMDIRCIRLSPYRHNGSLLLDVQQVIPLPEAAELTVRLKKREAAARVATQTNRDFTKYAIVTSDDESEPLAKRNAVMALVCSLHAHGIPAAVLAEALPGNRLRSVDGKLEGDALWAEFRVAHQQSEQRRSRWFVDQPLHEEGRSWVLFRNWGLNTEPTLRALVATAPASFSYRAENSSQV